MVRRLLAIILLCACFTISGEAQTDPSTLPRLEFADVAYDGAFRLPPEASNGFSVGRGGQAIAVNPEGPSIYVSSSSRSNRIAEFTIPTPVNSSNPSALPVATLKQGFADPTEGTLTNVWTNDVFLSSCLVADARLHCTASVYYDAGQTPSARFSHFSRGLNLATPSVSAWSNLEWLDVDTNLLVRKPGFVSGMLAHVPTEWQAKLGGGVISGQCCLPIITRTSFGPSAFAFNPSLIGQPVVSASPLLYYSAAHPTLGGWESSTETYGSSTEVTGLVIVPGTRTALYFGRNGLGPYCYGKGTANQSLHGTIDPTDGGLWCYDPTSASKGVHAYPYRYQMWAYDLNDFAAVKAGTKKPWEVRPYGVWPLNLPTPQAQVLLGGVSYDAGRRTIYVAQQLADPDQYEPRPIIHTLTTAIGTAPVPTPTPTNTTPPAPPTPVDPKIAELEAEVTALESKLAMVKTLLQQAAATWPKNTARVVKDAIVKALALIQ